jgi:hypothetical protein
MPQVKALIMLQLMITSAFFIQVGNATFHLSLFNRATGSNVLSLRCRNDSGFPVQRAMFFLNDTELTTANYASFMDASTTPGEVTFQINRWLEGMYSCGIGQVRSDTTSLIGKQVHDLNL